MRWPFSMFIRGSRSGPEGPDAAVDSDGAGDATSPVAAEAVTASGGAANGAGSAAPAGGPAAWRSLPAVQRSAGPAPLTAPALPFARGLAGRHGPEPTLAPLAHDVAADGTAGLVGGLAVPLVQRVPAAAVAAGGVASGSAALPVASGSHAVPGGQRAASARGSRGVTVADIPQRSAGDPAALVLPPAAPPRTLPAVDGAGVALDATHVAPASSPEPVRAVAPAMGADAAASPAVEAAAASVAPGVTDDASAFVAPAATPVSPPTATADDAATDDGAEAAHPSPAPGRRTLGESRRLGLGAPLTSRPTLQRVLEDGHSLPLAGSSPSSRGQATTAPQPSPTAPVIPAAGAAAPLPVLRLAAGPAPAGDPAIGSSGLAAASDSFESGTASAASGSRAGLPLVSRADRLGGEVLRPGSLPASAGEPGPDEFGAGMPDTASAPWLAVSLPLAQRSSAVDLEVGPGGVADPFAAAGDTGPDARPGDDESATGASSAGSPLDGTPVAATSAEAGGAGQSAGTASVQRLAGPRRSLQRLPAGPLTVSGAVAGRSWPAAEHPLAMVGGPMGAAAAHPQAASGVFPAALAPAGTAVARAPLAGSAGPASSLDAWAGSAGSSGARIGVGASHQSAYAGAAAMPVVARRSVEATDAAASGWRGQTSDGTSAGSGWSGGVGALGSSVDAGPAAAMVQRAITIDEITTTPQAPAPAGGGGAPGGSGGSQDIDALADKLYPKVRDRLTLDLLLDRERAGILGDW